MLTDYLNQIDSLHKKILQMKEYFDLAGLQKKLAELEKQTIEPTFWDNPQAALATTQQISELREKIEPWVRLEQSVEDVRILLDLAIEAQDESQESEIVTNINRLNRELTTLEVKSILNNEFDKHNCFLELHPGAGGTESCDWANMLLRMYLRWAEQQGFKTELIAIQPGDEAGIKSATVLVKGDYAFGYLKSEIGIHRLIRISPFDANKRRHTSFAAVFVYPEIDESIEIEIKESDLRIDTFRSSGAGGQHVNVTDSAVRITHLPTGIVVSCQNERSQHSNRAMAMKILRARLYEYEQRKKKLEAEKIQQAKKDIAWGNQIRTYIFHPYRLVKDHRTGVELGDIQSVMDGELTPFIEAYLKQQIRTSKSED
ncbi:MAG: peptide chain release factor 2 [bacterium]|nr:peptide chain release factor 2 [bacterium]